MERLTIDEVIAHCKRNTQCWERAEKDRVRLNGKPRNFETDDMSSNFMKEYWEHRQVAEWLEQLKSYKDAEEQGLLKILPVAIGSDVYFIPSKVNYELNVLNSHEENNRVYHQKVANIVFNERGWYLKCNLDLEYGVYHILVDKLYKETWFTSEEEAEQALKRMERK